MKRAPEQSAPNENPSRAAQPATAIRAPRGKEISCKGWHQEAALRMLCNNLDPDVAEKPDELIVYGGTGKAARSWADFDRIVRALGALENDETLLVQSGRAVGVVRTHEAAPRARNSIRRRVRRSVYGVPERRGSAVPR